MVSIRENNTIKKIYTTKVGNILYDLFVDLLYIVLVLFFYYSNYYSKIEYRYKFNSNKGKITRLKSKDLPFQDKFFFV